MRQLELKLELEVDLDMILHRKQIYVHKVK